MRILDSRRLRGPSLGAAGPGAMAEVSLEEGESSEGAEAAWRKALARMAKALDRESLAEGASVRRFAGGLALYVPAPVDALLAVTDLNEWAIDEATRALRGQPSRTIARARQELAARFREEASPRLVSLEKAARARDVPFLFDDDTVTLGHAQHAASYARDAIPRVSDVPWSAVGRIPVAIVTGTNGKTTTTRLVARMAKEAGLVVGNTSSDGVAIDGAVVERGDLTGGEAARQVLRDPRVQMAILETARGGLLRRGLAATPVDAAIITNVSADHLGEHGVLDLETMIATKLVAARAVRPTGRVVLFADDEGLMRGAHGIAGTRILFAERDASVAAHVAAGGVAYVARDGVLTRLSAGDATALVRFDAVPLTARGTARHNVKNALGAAALAYALGLPDEPVVRALRTFGTHADDNPGRGALHTLANGVRVVLDFGHNPAAAADLYAWARAMAGDTRVIAVLTQPGDRDDDAMEAFVRAAVRAGASEVVIWETESLFRGRAEGAIRDTLVRAAVQVGLSRAHVATAPDEAAALRHALGRARAGDVVVVSPSLDRTVPGDA